jgi:rare lipoprotein A
VRFDIRGALAAIATFLVRRPPLKKAIIAFASLLALTVGAEASSWTGKASYYGLKGRTANGGQVGDYTAAHRTLPFGAKVRVTNLSNNRSVVVTINDRGPFTGGRVIDVSTRAAEALGFRVAGVARVRVESLSD